MLQQTQITQIERAPSGAGAEGSLLDFSATSLHFFRLDGSLSSFFENIDLLERLDPLYKQLYDRGFSFRELNSRLMCGTSQGFMASFCGCGLGLVPLKWHCNNKSCPQCSKYRSNRIRRKLQPFLKQYDTNPHSIEFLGLITFSPENFDTIEEGYKQIRKDFSKFLRLKYVKERVKGGFPVIEVKTKNRDGEFKGWNIHLHFVYYGRYLDNRIRGHCNKCGQNLIKQDRYSKKYYCGNRFCNSVDVKVNGDSKLVRLYKKSSKKNVMIDVQRLSSHYGAIQYVTKYISANKDDFWSIDHQADYIFYMKNKKMISSVGIFFRRKFVVQKCSCRRCGLIKHFFYDELMVYELEQMRKPCIPPPVEEKIFVSTVKV